MKAAPRIELRETAPGVTLENPELGLRATVVEATPAIVSSRVIGAPGANGGPLHRHLRTEERFIVESGTVRVRRGLRGSVLASAGDTVVIPAGQPHSFLVEGGEAVFLTEFRPPHRIGDFFQELFALATGGHLDKRGNPRPADLAVLMHAYPEDFFYPPLVPPALLRTLMWPLARFATD
jgi:mannose-6-phosphate isomerase-like protein (cupin superfamily)